MPANYFQLSFDSHHTYSWPEQLQHCDFAVDSNFFDGFESFGRYQENLKARILSHDQVEVSLRREIACNENNDL